MNNRALLIAVLFFCCCSAFAEESSNLDSINLKIEEETRTLDGLNAESAQIEAKVSKIKGQIRELNSHGDALKKKLAETLEKRATTKAELDRNVAEIERISALSVQRMRIMYMLHSEIPSVSLVTTSQSDLGRSYYFLGKIKAYDRMLLERLATLKRDKEQESDQLSKVIEAQRKLQLDLNKQGSVLKSKVDEQAGLLASLAAQQAKVEQSLTELRAQALRLETVVVSLTNEDQKLERQGEKREDKVKDEVNTPFEGAGLFTFKGSLVKPVSGKLLKGFGKHHVENFADIVFNKGMEFETADNEEVKAIAPGKVIFVGRLPGYDTILIVDHGKRSHSLYGKLGAVEVKKGQLVDRGDLLAHTGANPSTEAASKSQFYFEIRVNGTPVDPVTYYKKGVFLS